MNSELLDLHLRGYLAYREENPDVAEEESEDRKERLEIYEGWNPERMNSATLDDLVGFFAPLWGMSMWGNKEYQVNQMITDNGLENLRSHLADLLWGSSELKTRWDSFRSAIKWVGPGMMSELLGYVHPDRYIIWNKITVASLNYLGFEDLPQKNHQINGESYQEICEITRNIRNRLGELSGRKHILLEVNYFLWDEVHSAVQEQSDGERGSMDEASETGSATESGREFLHDEVKEKIAEIGKWLGFHARIEVRVSAGSKVDAVWEATIGNMGRVIYVFEVQTRGSIDSLILNLLKSKKNPAVQGVVAVSDAKQLEKIKAHAEDVNEMSGLTCWDYADVLRTHERLEAVNESINRLGLVPEGF